MAALLWQLRLQGLAIVNAGNQLVLRPHKDRRGRSTAPVMEVQIVPFPCVPTHTTLGP